MPIRAGHNRAVVRVSDTARPWIIYLLHKFCSLDHGMVHIAPFEVTAWVDEHAHGVKHGLAGSVCAPLVIDFNLIDLDYKSPMQGGYKLRDSLGALYLSPAHGNGQHTVTRKNTLTCNAGIYANHIVLARLIGPEDHVICHYLRLLLM
ncbi:hypothetical protein LA080_008335 [Diaporthe eres]|nr:hypothetical protein LA080_008335 [Diaporthe eres]